MRRTRLPLALIAAAACALAACGSTYTWRWQTDKQVNPNDDNHPTSVRVLIYQLSSAAAFERTPVEQLRSVEAGRAALGDSFVAVAEPKEFEPDRNGTIELELEGTVTHIGVVALFDSLTEKDKTRVVVPVAEIEANTFVFQGYAIVLKRE